MANVAFFDDDFAAFDHVARIAEHEFAVGIHVIKRDICVRSDTQVPFVRQPQRTRGTGGTGGTGNIGSSGDFYTGISSDSRSESAGGDAGDVTVDARRLTLKGGGEITSDTSGSGRGGLGVRSHHVAGDHPALPRLQPTVVSHAEKMGSRRAPG